MGQPAVVMGDKINGSCPVHMVPAPNGGSMPSPAPLPFSAPLTSGLAGTVTINGKAAAVQGSSGLNTPPHSGLHPSDPSIAPSSQKGEIVKGSTSVAFDGKAAAYSGCMVTECKGVPAQLSGTATSVLVGA
jgi:uncharacterized Zn-binding protein involved in type VI secretion